MKRIHPFQCKKSSISLPRASYRRLLASQKIFTRNGKYLSEQEIYRRLFKLYLKNWRGRGLKTSGLRRYNADGKGYQIRPLYINQVLLAALWERSFHSGESISRMLDVAIRVYLPRLVEQLLQQPSLGSIRSTRNSPYWAHRISRRIKQYPDFFINYACKTLKNDGERLEYSQGTVIIPKSGLSPIQILDLMQIAA